jgi:hypothetical protein
MQCVSKERYEYFHLKDNDHEDIVLLMEFLAECWGADVELFQLRTETYPDDDREIDIMNLWCGDPESYYYKELTFVAANHFYVDHNGDICIMSESEFNLDYEEIE